MQTEDRRGIYCDLCGKPYRDQFSYYSGQLDKVQVDTQRAEKLDVDRRFLDIDICDGCYASRIKKPMLKVIREREGGKKGGKSKWT